MKITNNFYSAMGQLKSLERRVQKIEMLEKRYQESIDTDVNAGCVGKVDITELIENKEKLQWCLPHHHVLAQKNMRESEECATQQQSTKL